ncbi:hypothetical protein QBC45DRAFT_432065 [Copromyces sp. CBS 386.78]|nr:hypothetical protein QBC45DRAFT_432065 [Copromyces sp. CBS 386.78]
MVEAKVAKRSELNVHYQYSHGDITADEKRSVGLWILGFWHSIRVFPFVQLQDVSRASVSHEWRETSQRHCHEWGSGTLRSVLHVKGDLFGLPAFYVTVILANLGYPTWMTPRSKKILSLGLSQLVNTNLTDSHHYGPRPPSQTTQARNTRKHHQHSNVFKIDRLTSGGATSQDQRLVHDQRLVPKKWGTSPTRYFASKSRYIR